MLVSLPCLICFAHTCSSSQFVAMALVNIGQDNKDDGFYRYKMPKLMAKIEGRGNGIKTNVVNMVEVAKALARPPSYTTKYFGCVLGAQSKFDEKTGTSTVNGAHDTPKLVQLLEGFIKKYVQCYGCGNPETEIVITKKQMIHLKCAACGFLSDVDMRDKLTTFILNNPPEVKKKAKSMRRAEKERIEAGKALDEEKKKTKKSSSKKKEKEKEEEAERVSPSSSQKDEDDDDEDDDVEWQTDTSAEAAKLRMAEQLSAATAEMVMVTTEEKEGKKDKAKKDVAPANGHASVEAEEEGEEEDEEEEEAKENGTANGETDDQKKYKALVADLGDYVKTHKLAEVATYVQKEELTEQLLAALLEVLFGDIPKGFTKEFTKKKALFAAILGDEEEAQTNFLHALEYFFAVKAAAAVKEIAVVMKVGAGCRCCGSHRLCASCECCQ